MSRRLLVVVALALVAACGSSPTAPDTSSPPPPAPSTPTAGPPPIEPTPPVPGPQEPPCLCRTPDPVPVPQPSPAPVSVPYYGRLTTAQWTGAPQLPSGFIVEWYPDRLDFGPLRFPVVTGSRGDTAGTAIAHISDGTRTVARVTLTSADGKFWSWTLTGDGGTATGTLERR